VPWFCDAWFVDGLRGGVVGVWGHCHCLGTIAHAHVLIINLDLRVVRNISQMTVLRIKARLSMIGDGSFLGTYSSRIAAPIY